MELKQIMVVSIHHTTTDERAKCFSFESLGPQTDKQGNLTGWTLENVGVFADRGWVMHVHSKADEQDQTEFSAGLQAVVEMAVHLKAEYIRFDVMIETTPMIPEYRQ